MQWYRCRWGIEEWHRLLKTGCHAEARKFKTAAHLQRVLAFDLIVAWRPLACLKLGRTRPELPASILYTPDELAVLCAQQKKRARRRTTRGAPGPTDTGPGQPLGGDAGRLPRPRHRRPARRRNPDRRLAPARRRHRLTTGNFIL